MLAGLKRVTHVKLRNSGLKFTQDFVEAGSATWTVILTVPSRGHHGPLRAVTARTIVIGKLSHAITKAGEHKITMRFSHHGRLALARHPRSKVVLDTSFRDKTGRRFAVAKTLRR